jgi:hypothetical protein
MVKAMSIIGSTGIAASTILAIVGAFVSVHVFVTALIAFASSIGLQGIASNRK